MNLFRKLGFEKSDERGVYIASKALRNTWVVHSATLLVWLIVELIKNGATSVFFILLIILLVGITAFWGFYLYYLKKTSG